MIVEPPAAGRELKTDVMESDLVVVGGGMAGVCAAITAARQGLRVTLVQDRPVLGGNASSEIRLWVLGATCHMGANNRWAREGGVIDELLVENVYRNPEGNPLIFDTVLLEKISEEKNITLLLNTSVYEVQKSPEDPDRITAVRGFCSQNSTRYDLRAPLFLDSSGDGIVGFLAGAAFRIGAESPSEFGERFAPSGEFGQLLGHSIYFYSKDVGQPVKFIAPSFALKNIEVKIPRYRQFNAKEHGCRLWWIEWGGRLDTIHESEKIKWELWRVVYGVWDYIKNSGKFPDAENLTLEWIGHIPGKRESRRFEGPYMLRQQDIVERRIHADGVAFGGWSIDLHPADGVFSNLAGSHHLHSKGPYQIPLRCLFSRNIRNLFLAGRIISSSHVAFGSTRVMATGAHCGQAVGIAANLCKRLRCLPADLLASEHMRVLHRDLLRTGQHVPAMTLEDSEDLAKCADITASSRLQLASLPPSDVRMPLKNDTAQLLPLPAGAAPRFTLHLHAAQATTVTAELRTTSRIDHHCPDVTLATKSVSLKAGENTVVLDFSGVSIDQPRCAFLCLLKSEHVSVRCSERLVTGVAILEHYRDEKTSSVGGEDYQIWCTIRRPKGHNFALAIDPPIDLFGPGNVTNGVQRPTHLPNAWVAAPVEGTSVPPTLTLRWKSPQTLRRIELFFDVDFDHALESVLMGQPERELPFCVKHYRLRDAAGKTVHEFTANHQARNIIRLDSPITTDTLHVDLLATCSPRALPALFEVRCYA